MTTAISFFQSLFMKKEESYHICGIDVKFQKENKDNNFFVYKVPEKPPSNIALKAIDKFSKQL